MGRKYIGVDLGAWYGNKTRIAVLEKNTNKLEVKLIKEEPTKSTTDPKVRNEKLVECLKEKAEDNALIGIDAPFAIPSCLNGGKEECKFKSGEKAEIDNPYIFDNSARFVYQSTKIKPLAPAGDKIGKMTARMVHIVDNYSEKLNITKVPISKNDLKTGIHTFEVFPTATLYLYILNKLNGTEEIDKYLGRLSENKENSLTTLISYKNDYWKGKKDKPTNKERMLKLIKDDINIDAVKEEIETDDDYDAIICALTVYLIDEYGYKKPDMSQNQMDETFKNSFIYMPNLSNKKEK